MVCFRLICVIIIIVFHDVSCKLTCTFDVNLCSWTQNRDDDFDWIQQSGSTNDPTSGPEVDHTSGHGKYMLASGKQTHGMGWKALLSSPNLIITSPTNMTFWYHMNGVGIGNLTVTTTDRYGRKVVIWQKHGRQSSEWQSATVSIGLLTSFITFEGRTKFHYSADIALDDIRLSSEPIVLSNLNPVVTLPTTTSNSHVIDLSCDFEQGLCHWSQDDKTDDFDWLISHDRSPDHTSGPEGDHTMGRKYIFNTPNGNYLLLNGHQINNENLTAIISSPLINIQQNTNLTFWYHMNGVGIGHLAVYTQYTNGRRESLLSMSGRQGADWQPMSIILPAGLYKLVFEGSVKRHYGGDLALDDIQIHGHPVQTLNTFG